VSEVSDMETEADVADDKLKVADAETNDENSRQ